MTKIPPSNQRHSVGTRLALSDTPSDNLSHDALPEQLQTLIHDLRREMQSIESLIAFVLNDVDAAALSIDNLSRKMAVQEIFELILRRKDAMNDMLNLASYHVELAQSPES